MKFQTILFVIAMTLFSTSIQAQGQEHKCEDVIEAVEDKMTGKKSVSVKELLVISDDQGETGFGIFAMKVQSSLVYSIQVSGAGRCIDRGDEVNILFRDGTKLKSKHMSDFNCDAKCALYFGGALGNNDALNELQSKEIETIRVWTSDSYMQKDFTPEQSKKLLAINNCLFDY